MLGEGGSYWPFRFARHSRFSTCAVPQLKLRPNSATPYLGVTQYPAEIECFLTRLGCSIKDGSLFMNSVAEFFKNRALAVIMTGMGSDGASGMTAIFRHGGLTFGQDEASCAVYGMPRVCAQLGVLTHVLSLLDIPTHIIHATRCRRRA